MRETKIGLYRGIVSLFLCLQPIYLRYAEKKSIKVLFTLFITKDCCLTFFNKLFFKNMNKNFFLSRINNIFAYRK